MTSSYNVSAQTLKDIENIDLAKNGFDREDLPKDGSVPADLPNSYKPTNVHVFLSTPIRATEWDSVLRNVNHASDLEKCMKGMKDSKSENVFPKNGGSEPYRMTVFNLEGNPEFDTQEQRVLVATNNNNASSSSEDLATEAKIVSLPVTALLSASPENKAPWNDASLVKDHSADRFVMICSHVKRDPRCGACGAMLVDILLQEVAKQQAEMAKESAEKSVGAFVGKVHIARCSHVGGHAHAANMAVVSKDGGMMLGCMNPTNVNDVARCLLSSAPLVQSLTSIESLKTKVRGLLLAGIRAPKL